MGQEYFLSIVFVNQSRLDRVPQTYRTQLCLRKWGNLQLFRCDPKQNRRALRKEINCDEGLQHGSTPRAYLYARPNVGGQNELFSNSQDEAYWKNLILTP